MYLRRLAESVAIAVATANVSAPAASLYQVGNSLTVDSVPGAIVGLAQAAGIDLTNGYHVRGASTLSTIWSNPSDYSEVSGAHGVFPDALAGFSWDYLVLQAFYNGASLSSDVAQFQQFRDLARANPDSAGVRLYAYAPWPHTFYWREYELPVADTPELSLRHQRDTFYHLVDRLNAAAPEDDWRLIPVGEVFNEVRRRIASDGRFADITRVEQLYRDPVHANPRGQYLAAATIFATLFRTSPVGLSTPRWARENWTEANLSNEFVAAAQQLVWDVVTTEKRTGVSPWGDIDLDTFVDADDRALLNTAWGGRSSLSADGNRDGVVDLNDLDLWALAFAAGPADLNGDNAQNAADHAALTSVYGSVGARAADLNGDLRVDAADYTLWRDAATAYQAADYDRDGVVTVADQVRWRGERGWRVDLPEDVNRDGVVDAADYTLWRDNLERQITLGERPAGVGQTVPEPATLAVAALGLLFGVFRRPAQAPLVPVERLA